MGVGLAEAWRVVAASVEGASHLADGRPCQDAHAVELLHGDVAVLVVADGAGSAPRAGEGAGIATAAAARSIVTTLDAIAEHGTGDAAGWRQLVAGGLVAARTALEAAAGASIGDLATTLAVVVATPRVLACAQVGDGAVVIDRGGALEVVGDAPAGEYLNETTFVTSSRWAEDARVDVEDGADVAAVAVMSDGLHLLAFDVARREPHRPFFDPLYRFAASEDATAEELAAFLASERVCQRTDDDKTLVLAVRPGGPAADG